LRLIDRWTDLAEPAVRELLVLRRLRDGARARAEAEPTVEGSKGQPKESPAWATYVALVDRVVRLEAELLLTPRAVQRAGVQMPVAADGFDELDAEWAEIYGRPNPFDELAAGKRKRGGGGPRR
jgi:hypothetical protein